jgi:hypothetical protein
LYKICNDHLQCLLRIYAHVLIQGKAHETMSDLDERNKGYLCILKNVMLNFMFKTICLKRNQGNHICHINDNVEETLFI